MARLLKTKNARTTAGTIIQHALFEANVSFQVHRWDEATDTNTVVEETSYEGWADRIAARAMALGALDSLHRQAKDEAN